MFQIFGFISKLFGFGQRINTISLSSQKFVGFFYILGVFTILYANYIQDPQVCDFGTSGVDPKVGNVACYSKGTLIVNR